MGHFVLLMHIMWRSFLPSSARRLHLWLAHSLTFWIELLGSTAHMHPHCWAHRLAFFPSAYSTCCHWTHHCAFSSPHQLQLPFNTHSYTVGLCGKYGNILTFSAVRLEIWSSATLRLSGSDSRASACLAVLRRRRLSWPAFSRGIPNASSSALQHSRQNLRLRQLHAAIQFWAYATTFDVIPNDQRVDSPFWLRR